MLILGITDGISCGAALIQDGALVAAVNEEALTRLKMALGFPRQAIAEVMRIGGAAPDDIDLVCGCMHTADLNTFVPFAGKHVFEIDKTPPPWRKRALNAG